MTDAEKVKQAQAILQIKENMPALIESFAVQAKMHRAKYEALIKEGFTESQAIELCKILF